jgi:dCTP deaminase
MMLNDLQIQESGIIEPFEPQTREVCEYEGFINYYSTGEIEICNQVPTSTRKVISYGVSSFGYDIRVSPTSFKVFRHLPGKIVDPKDFDPDFLEDTKICKSDSGDYFVLPANSYALCHSLERFSLPKDVIGVCLGKSTYARCGVIANITPLEPGWQGYLTIELSNSSKGDVKIYAGEGIAQVLFFKGEQPSVTYDSRNGKYQNQSDQIVTAKV